VDIREEELRKTEKINSSKLGQLIYLVFPSPAPDALPLDVVVVAVGL
jgi:hypothetical protein